MNNNAFAINGFTGMTTEQIISFWAVFALFNLYALITAIDLVLFFFASRNLGGRTPTAALWHFAALCFMMLAFISTVWAAPAEKSILNDAGTGFDFSSARAMKLFIGLVFFVLPAILCMIIGGIHGRAQRRSIRREVLGTAA